MARRSRFRELPPSKLRWQCDPASLGFETTDEVERCRKIIGQERALAAIKLGLDVPSVGYNIFVAGLSGSGRTHTVAALLRDITRGSQIPGDKLYVHNFRDPLKPRLIRLEAGQGRRLAADMERLIHECQKWIPASLESEAFQERARKTQEDFSRREANLFQQLQDELAAEGFALVQMQVGPATHPDLMPMIEGQPVPFDKLDELVTEGKLTPEKIQEFRGLYPPLKERLDASFRLGRKLGRELQAELEKLRFHQVDPILREDLEEIARNYSSPSLNEYFSDVHEAITSHLGLFLNQDEPDAETGSRQDPFRWFRVNLLVDNERQEGAPVIQETSPSYQNLYGTIEQKMETQRSKMADFLDIRAGSLIQADGGYLVLNLLDVASEDGVWHRLKRILKYREITIQGPEAQFPLAISALKPEPISIDLKVIVIGDEELYRTLQSVDPDFPKVFKVKAEFGETTPRTRRRLKDYCGFVARLCQDEKLPHLQADAMALLLEESVRIAGRRSKLSTRFSDLADLVRESAYWARRDSSPVVTREHIQQAVEQREYRVRAVEDRWGEMLEAGTLMVDTRREVTGQVNGLAVFDLGDHQFGKPARITAVATAGKAGIINIEREAKLSGSSHDKGVLILTGYLRRLFARKVPLTLTASLCFEQSYGPVDGDSASSTEIYALLSSLAGLPIRQGLAVTGSMNQQGEIQAIGGVNWKIEGFFQLCRKRKLTGDQGVLIPASNVEHLALRMEVVDAVERGEFHVYPVSTVEQGISILTGVSAGKRRPDGSYPPRSVLGLAAKRLQELAQALKESAS